MHYVYLVAGGGTENTWMLIELIANHSVPLFMLSLKLFTFFVYCMHEADWTLVDTFDIFQAD